MPKYLNRPTSINNTRLYKQMLKDRGVLSIQQFRTKYFNKIDASLYNPQTYIWTKKDKLIRLSNFNQKPTDAHFEIGDEVFIPPVSLFDIL
jgi:hypothetical protein